jgi:hypothetical protein
MVDLIRESVGGLVGEGSSAVTTAFPPSERHNHIPRRGE